MLALISEPPLYPNLNEINAAAANGMPLIALAMCAALPDICVSLLSPDGRTDGKAYIAWCESNLPSEQFGFINGKDLYSMRCGVLHNGRFGDMKNSVGRVIFALPGLGSFVNCRVNDAYIYSVVDFCRNFTGAVHRWFEANKEHDTLKANLPRLMQYRPDGLEPYLVGMKVLA